MKATEANTFTARVRRGEIFSLECPSRGVLKDVTSLWGVLVMLALRGGTLRFSDLRRRAAGVSEKMLAQTLHALEEDGFVKRVARPVVPPHVEYSLTPLGEGTADRLASLVDWIEGSLPKVMQAKRKRAKAQTA